MVKGVYPDLVPLRRHAPDQSLPFRVARQAGAHQKKGGGELPQGQTVQQPPGGGGPGPVVKGEGHQSALFRQLHRSRAPGGQCLSAAGEHERQHCRQQGRDPPSLSAHDAPPVFVHSSYSVCEKKREHTQEIFLNCHCEEHSDAAMTAALNDQTPGAFPAG